MLPQPQPQSEKKEEKKETRERAIAAAGAFDRFWQAYPHKVGKPDAARSFLKVASEVESILEGLSRYIAGKPPDRSWLNPSTFINQRRWEDSPAITAGAQNGRSGQGQGVSVSQTIQNMHTAGEGFAFGPRPSLASGEVRSDDVRMLPAR
jgi:hypothetical protein